jgi:transcriptional regulator with XRE-family HTH domain
MSKQDEIARFCANVRRHREQGGLTQRALAEALETDIGTIVLLEDGILTDTVDIEMLFRMCRLFGVEPSALFRAME